MVPDDQPIPIKVRNGRLITIPYSTEINDIRVMGVSRLSGRQMGRDDEVILRSAVSSKEQENGMVVCMPLHPFVVGHPHRISALYDVLQHVTSHEDVWLATAGEIADWYLEHHYDEAVALPGIRRGGPRMTTARLTYPHRRRGLDHEWFPHEPTHKRPRRHLAGGQARSRYGSLFPLSSSRLTRRRSRSARLGGLCWAIPISGTTAAGITARASAFIASCGSLDGFGSARDRRDQCGCCTRYPRLIDETGAAQLGVHRERHRYGPCAPRRPRPSTDERELIQQARTRCCERATGAAVQRLALAWTITFAEYADASSPNGDFEYVTDWANDDMPYMVATKAGPLCAMPLTYEWSDRLLLVQHNLTVDDYVDQVLQAFARLTAEAGQYRSGRILSLSVTPWILGYPHRIAALERLLGRILESNSVWHANGMEIVDAFKRQSLGAA